MKPMRLALIFAALVATPALAQPAPDPSLLQQVVPALQAQRNDALDRAAVAEAQARMAHGEIDKLKARIKDLESAAEPKPAPR